MYTRWWFLLLLTVVFIVVAMPAAGAQNIPPQSGEAYHELIEKHNKYGIPDGTDWESKIPRTGASPCGHTRAESKGSQFASLAALLHSVHRNGVANGDLGKLVQVNPEVIAQYFGGDIRKAPDGAYTFVDGTCYMTVGQLLGFLSVMNEAGQNLPEAARSLFAMGSAAAAQEPAEQTDMVDELEEMPETWALQGK